MNVRNESDEKKMKDLNRRLKELESSKSKNPISRIKNNREAKNLHKEIEQIKNKRNQKITALVLAIFFAVLMIIITVMSIQEKSENERKKKSIAETKDTSISQDTSADDEESMVYNESDQIVNDMSDISKTIEIESGYETEYEPEMQSSKPEHFTTEWKPSTIGPMTFDAPSSWYLNQGFYYPHDGVYEDEGYYISVGYNEHLNIDKFIERDLGQYEDVSVEESEIDGCYAVCLSYFATEIDSDQEKYNTVYYIQIYPEKGVGIVTYEAPVSYPDKYEEEYYRVINSMSINKELADTETSTKNYILNQSTGTFHKPDCYKVKQIMNPVSTESTKKEMLDNGYIPCEICDPN